LTVLDVVLDHRHARAEMHPNTAVPDRETEAAWTSAA
jgi:hypothetical protein